MLFAAWIVAACLVFILSESILGFAGLASYLTQGSAVSPALGIGFFATLSLVLGLMPGGYTVLWQTIAVAVGVVFVFIYKEQLQKILDLRLRQLRRRDLLWLAFPAIYFLTRFFSSGLPQQHSDPLYYHLAAPKFWAQLGQIRLTATHPSFSQAALWETLYGIPQLWLGTTGMNAHVIAQIAAQWMHAFWGELGCVFLVGAILKRFVPRLKEHRGLCYFAAWLCVCPPGIEWLGCLAKNDYIMALFILAAVVEMIDHRYFLAGLCAGFSYAVKVLGAWGAIALVVFLPWEKLRERRPQARREFWRAAGVYALGSVLAVAPIIARNLIWTGNPVFPNLDSVIGPHWISQLWINHNLSFGGPIKFNPKMLAWAWHHLFEGALPKVLIGLGAVAMLWRRMRTSRLVNQARLYAGFRAKRWWMFLGIQVVLALLMLRPEADGRYGIYIEILTVAWFTAAGLEWLISALDSGGHAWRRGIVTVVILALGLLINSPVDQLVKIPRHYLFRPMSLYVKELHPLYGMYVWVNNHVPPDEKIFFCEKQNFYIDHPYQTVDEMRIWEQFLTPIRSAHELFAKLRAMGYRYAQFSPQTGGYPPTLRPYWNQIMALRKHAAYNSPTSLIIDLNAVK